MTGREVVLFSASVPPLFLLTDAIRKRILPTCHGSNARQRLHDEIAESVWSSSTGIAGKWELILPLGILSAAKRRCFPFDCCTHDEINELLEEWIEDFIGNRGLSIRFLPETPRSQAIFEHFRNIEFIALIDGSYAFKETACGSLLQIVDASVGLSAASRLTVWDRQVLDLARQLSIPLAGNTRSAISMLRRCLTAEHWLGRAVGAADHRFVVASETECQKLAQFQSGCPP
jgi:hypothetical protein